MERQEMITIIYSCLWGTKDTKQEVSEFIADTLISGKPFQDPDYDAADEADHQTEEYRKHGAK